MKNNVEEKRAKAQGEVKWDKLPDKEDIVYGSCPRLEQKLNAQHRVKIKDGKWQGLQNQMDPIVQAVAENWHLFRYGGKSSIAYYWQESTATGYNCRKN